MKYIIYILALSALIACDNKYEACNDLLSPCAGSQDGEYCLFGYKWGEDADFAPNGLEAIGPASAGGLITYSFQTDNRKISIHNRHKQKTLSFDEKGSCARTEVRNALQEYEAIANLTFIEQEDNALSDIQFFVLDDDKPNVGNVNFQDKLCSDISGYVIFNNKHITSCHNFFILALHEVGHALGLGHVSTPNIMKTGGDKYSFDGLQAGDIQGIISIYGEK